MLGTAASTVIAITILHLQVVYYLFGLLCLLLLNLFFLCTVVVVVNYADGKVKE